MKKIKNLEILYLKKVNQQCYIVLMKVQEILKIKIVADLHN